MLSISNGQALKGAALWLTRNELWWFGKKKTRKESREHGLSSLHGSPHPCLTSRMHSSSQLHL